MKRSLYTAAAVVLAAASFAACSDDDDDSPSDVPTSDVESDISRHHGCGRHDGNDRRTLIT